MAHLVWRRGSKAYLYYYDPKAAKLVQVPRSVTKAWDGLPPEEVEALKRQWEADHGQAKDRIERLRLDKDDRLSRLWASYQTDRMRFKKRRKKTADSEQDLFEAYICRYFVGQNQKKDPTQWHDLVPGFHGWLFDQPIADAHRRKILWALERFGKYLVFTRVMTFPFVIQTPTRDNTKETPLKVKLTPDEVLRVCRTHEFRRPHKKHASTNRKSRIHFRLAILCGYFFGLRPEELWALEREDFLTGALAVERAKTHEGFTAAGLGSRLAVVVNKSLTGGKVEHLVKTDHSFGFTLCWHPDAAREIAALLKEASSGRLFPFSRGYLDRYWRELVFPVLGVTAHDLRRASSVYLGRTVRVPATLLQEHLRHAELETTLLYMREPTAQEHKRESDTQDFDEVV